MYIIVLNEIEQKQCLTAIDQTHFLSTVHIIQIHFNFKESFSTF